MTKSQIEEERAMGYKNVKVIITLTARQIAELAKMHGFDINMGDFGDDDLDGSEYTIITCPESGVLDEETGQVIKTTYCAYPEATYGDGECEPLTDPWLAAKQDAENQLNEGSK